MRYVRVVNRTTGRVLAERAAVADSAWSRFLGLQGRPELSQGTGLVLLPNNSIHMLFMRFPIDAVFVTARGEVARVGRRLRPWTIGPVVPGALYCVELPAGAATDTTEGHTVEMERL